MDQEQINSLVREQGEFAFERMFSSMEKVKERLDRACHALEANDVDYAIVGGNAVAAWVATRDEGAIRNTQDVDILLRPEDFEAAKSALTGVGFVAHEVMNVTIFLDGADGKPSEGVHVLWAGQKVRDHYASATPMPDSSTKMSGKRVVDLVELVRMKLNSYRRKDQVHLLDLIGVGLIDSDWTKKFDSPLDQRLQTLLDDPDG
jgi:hypothetical protein